MKPGKDLDMLIAEKIMGWVLEPKYVHRWTSPVGTRSDDSDIPNYSTDIAAAFEVVEVLAKEGAVLNYSTMKDGVRGHFVEIGYLRNPFDSFHAFVEVSGESAPHAYCLGALQTKQ